MTGRQTYLWTFVFAFGLGLGACSGGSSSLPGSGPFERRHTGTTPIQHVVLIVQENRSFDNLFALFPGANGATRGKEKVKKNGKYVDKWVTLKPQKLALGNDLQHCHSAFETEYDNGAMDGFNLIGKGVCPTAPPARTQPYHYVQQSDITPYWNIADQWVLADAMFQTQGSGSFTAHQDLIRGGTCFTGASSCNLSSPTSSTLSLIDNATNFPWGCDAATGTKTWTINIYGQVARNGPFPCTADFPDYGSQGYTTMRDLLDNAGVSWKYYTPCFSNKVQTGCSPSSDCNGGGDCAGGTLNAFDVIWSVRNGPEWGTNVSWPETNIFTDITNNALPAVSWVIPEDANSDHPGEKCKCDNGPSWVASVVNAIGASGYWNSTAIVVVWDDWGGFYDNAVPPLQDKWGGLGFRVPMLVISPYAIAGSGSQGGYVAHTQYEFGSILKYIEQNFNLGSLNTTDTRATSIANIFNYAQSPRVFATIPSRYSKAYFLKHANAPQHGDPE
jgi:phospholipase C